MTRRDICVTAFGVAVIIAFECRTGNADTLRAATPTETSQIEMCVFYHFTNPPTIPVRMALPDTSPPVLLYLDDRKAAWHEPAFRVKKDWLSGQSDSVIIAVHRLVAVESYLARVSERTSVEFSYCGSVVDIIRDSAGTLIPIARINCDEDSAHFPISEYGDWLGGGQVVDVQIISLGAEPAQVVSVTTAADWNDGCDEYEGWEKYSLWVFSRGALRPLHTFERKRFKGGSGGESRFEASFGVADVDGVSGNELIYSRNYSNLDYPIRTTCTDPGSIVYDYFPADPPGPPTSSIGNVSGLSPDEGGYAVNPFPRQARLVPSWILFANDSLLPIRSRLPILIYPEGTVGGSWESIYESVNGPEYFGPPTGGGHVIDLDKEYLTPTPARGRYKSDSPSLSIRSIGDSVEFVVEIFHIPGNHYISADCESGEYSIILWIDRNLYGDFDDRDAGGDDIAFIAYHCSADSLACIEEYSFAEEHGAYRLELQSQSHGRYVVSRPRVALPTVVNWKLAASDLGLTTRPGSPTSCGIAIEVLCSGSFTVDDFHYRTGGWTYPSWFVRTDPRTWAILMLADRRDSSGIGE